MSNTEIYYTIVRRSHIGFDRPRNSITSSLEFAWIWDVVWNEGFVVGRTGDHVLLLWSGPRVSADWLLFTVGWLTAVVGGPASRGLWSSLLLNIKSPAVGRCHRGPGCGAWVVLHVLFYLFVYGVELVGAIWGERNVAIEIEKYHKCDHFHRVYYGLRIKLCK